MTFEKNYNELILNLIEVKLGEEQHDFVRKAKAKNTLSYVYNLMDLNYYETAEQELKKLLKSPKIKVLGFED